MLNYGIGLIEICYSKIMCVDWNIPDMWQLGQICQVIDGITLIKQNTTYKELGALFTFVAFVLPKNLCPYWIESSSDSCFFLSNLNIGWCHDTIPDLKELVKPTRFQSFYCNFNASFTVIQSTTDESSSKMECGVLDMQHVVWCQVNYLPLAQAKLIKER